MVFPKQKSYINSIYNVSLTIHDKAISKKDNRLIAISSIITNYFNKILKENNLTINDLQKSNYINLVPFFEYVSTNNIEFFDFNNIKVTDVDVSKDSDLERFVLSHIYYLTQK